MGTQKGRRFGEERGDMEDKAECKRKDMECICVSLHSEGNHYASKAYTMKRNFKKKDN